MPLSRLTTNGPRLLSPSLFFDELTILENETWLALQDLDLSPQPVCCNNYMIYGELTSEINKLKCNTLKMKLFVLNGPLTEDESKDLFYLICIKGERRVIYMSIVGTFNE